MKQSRKSLLISSVALLLVAMLALGTATFAWFTQTTRADANGIYAKAVKASNLLISKVPSPQDSDWASSIDYQFGTDASIKTMYPTSSTNGVNWVKADAAEAAVFTMKSDTLGFINTNDGQVPYNNTTTKYVFKSMLNIKNAGDAQIKSVQIASNFATAAGFDYVRMALVPTNAAGTTLTDFATSVYATTQTEYTAYGGLDTDNNPVATATANITPNAWSTITVGNMDPGATEYYALFVWFEGQDTTNIDANANKLIDGLTFTVSGTPS